MKFIHAGDLHIDSPLSGLSAHADAPAEALRTATRSAFVNLIDEAIERKVLFCMFPGDLYDGDWPDYQTGYFFINEMTRLNRHGIRAFVIFGNHDAANTMTKRLSLPDNVAVFSADRPETHYFDADGIKFALHGQSFKEKETTTNLVPGYPSPIPGHLNLGLLHTALEGNASHATYAPCSLDELRAKRYDGWLLGHVHEFAILESDPLIAYSGCLQGRHVREPGARGALLHTIEDGKLLPPERLFVDVVRWAVARIDISGCADRAEVGAAARAEFERIVREAGDRSIACRVVLTGRSSAHADLFGQARALRAELTAEAIIAGGERFWLEKIKVESEPALDAEAIRANADAIAAMQELLQQAAKDPEFLTSLKDEFGTLVGKIGSDFDGQEAPAFDAARKGDFAALIAAVAPTVLERIAKEG